jgi:DNA modification methylase
MMNWRDRVKEFRRVPASQLKANPKNWREHPPEQQRAMKGVLDEIGIAGALLARETADGLELIDGHLRTEMADDTAWPVLILDVNENEADVLLASVDPIGALAKTNADQLASLLGQIETENADLDSLLRDLEKSIPTQIVDGETDPDDIPTDDRIEKRCEPGDLWIMGRHRLLCGDSTSADDMERAFALGDIGCVLTDPPYGISLDTDYFKIIESKKIVNRNGGRQIIGNDYKRVLGDEKPFDASALSELFCDVEEQFWFGANYYRRSLGGTDLDGSWLVWDKRPSGWNDGGESIDDVFGSAFELIWTKQKHQQRVLRKQWAGFTARNRGMERSHPTEKPVDLLVELLERWSPNACGVADPFAGSGTCVIACEQTGRTCYAMEIDPQYCDVILARWEAFTGSKVERA